MAQESAVTPEDVQAIRERAEQGDAVSQFHLCSAYHRSRGVARDRREAYIWFYLTVGNGDDQTVRYRDLAAKHLLPANRVAAEREAE